MKKIWPERRKFRNNAWECHREPPITQVMQQLLCKLHIDCNVRALLHSTYALAKLKERDRAPPEATELMTVTAEGDVQGHPQECAANPKTKRHDGCESDHHRSISASKETHRRGKSRMPLPRKRKGLQQDNGYDNGIEYRDCQRDDYEKSEDGRDLQSPSPLDVERKIALPVAWGQTLRRTNRKPWGPTYKRTDESRWNHKKCGKKEGGIQDGTRISRDYRRKSKTVARPIHTTG